MLRLFHAILTGLVGAALLHVIIILALPHYVKATAYERVSAFGGAGSFHRLPDAASPFGLPSGPGPARAEANIVAPIVNQDPYLAVSACTVSMENGPVRLYAAGDVPLWSVVIFDRESNEVFSMNDRTSVSGALDILLARKAELPAIRKNLPEDLSQSILVEMPREGGYAVLRAFVPRASFVAGAEDFLGTAECGPWKPDAGG